MTLKWLQLNVFCFEFKFIWFYHEDFCFFKHGELTGMGLYLLHWTSRRLDKTCKQWFPDTDGKQYRTVHLGKGKQMSWEFPVVVEERGTKKSLGSLAELK
jgi:hypothetical protein